MSLPRLPRALMIAAIVLAPAGLSAVQQSAAATQKPDSPATALIVGRVVDATTERPIAGALVVTFTERGETAVLSNSAGQFVIDGLPAGPFPLFVSKFGYVSAQHGQPHSTGQGSGLTLEAGARVTDVVIRLWKRGAITGRVVDERGEPLVELEIAAFRLGAAPAPGLEDSHHALHTTTDDRGVYRLGALAPGDYLVFVPSTQTAVPRALVELSRSSTNRAERAAIRQALGTAGSTRSLPGSVDGGMADGDFIRTIGVEPSPSRGAGMVYRTTFYQSAATSSEAAVISVAAGQERSGIDIALQPIASVRVSGRLSGTEGPVALQPVRLVHDSVGDFASATDPPVATSVTDATGAFTFIGVPAGKYRLLSLSMPEEHQTDDFREVGVGVTSGGVSTEVALVAAAAPPRAVDSQAKPVQWSRESVSVADTNVDGVLATFRRGFRFTGRVVFEGSPAPIPGSDPWLALSIERADGRAIGFDRWVDQDPENLPVDARSTFETGYVPPGRYLLRVPRPPPGWRLKSAVSAGRDLTDDVLEVEADVDDLVLTFAETTRLTGRVAGSADAATSGVVLFPSRSRALDEHRRDSSSDSHDRHRSQRPVFGRGIAGRRVFDRRGAGSRSPRSAESPAAGRTRALRRPSRHRAGRCSRRDAAHSGRPMTTRIAAVLCGLLVVINLAREAGRPAKDG